MFSVLSQRYTFRRQLGITISIGIIIMALCSSVVGSWQSNKQVRNDLIEQGQHLTENLARQSALALIYSSAENATEAVNATMSFPGVIGLEIHKADGSLLLKRGETYFTKFHLQRDYAGDLQTAAVLYAESNKSWSFIAPVFSLPRKESPFGEGGNTEFLGEVSVVISKQALSNITTNIFMTNLAISFSFALLFIFLIRYLANNMMRPLNQLSECMRRTQEGESQVRAIPDGPKDVIVMSHSFNNMMSVLEEREAALRVAAIAFETNEGILVTDANAQIIQVNRAFTKLTGYNQEDVIGKNPSILKSNHQNAEFYQNMWGRLKRDKSWEGEIWNRRKNGQIYPEWLNITAVVDKDGEVTHYVGSFVDFTEQKKAESEIHYLAFYDPLTRLPNRRLLVDRLRQAVISCVRHHTSGALLFIDLDNFKTLNDTKGHDIGDLMLIEVAKRLQSCVREGDTVSRFGGDEFVLLLEELSEEAAQAATQVQAVGEKILDVLRHPYILEGTEFHSSSSIGITLFSHNHVKIDELLKHADTAMYEAKKSGRNALRFFDPVMQEKLEIRTKLESGLREALRNNEFRLYYQIQVDHKRNIAGAEVLLRWMHPEQGLLLPLHFIPLAEESGLILPIGKWVLESACLQLKSWETNPMAAHLQLAVNVSGRQFRQPDFVAQVIEILDRTAINPLNLKLELTESIVLDDVPDTISKMQALKQIGISFSMDDFGTGYSSLSYLTQLPLNQLKIDKSFVKNISTKTSDTTIIQTIIGMAENLSMEVIAEGVETQEQCHLLEKMGCVLYQGYLFSKPLPLDEFEQLVKHQEVLNKPIETTN